jgi:hypothetical protein
VKRDARHRSPPAAEGLPILEGGRNIVAVIGIDKYEHHRELDNAVKDALGVQELFVDKLGFSAPLPPLLDEGATKEAITELVQDGLRKELQPADSLLLFFAGHGYTHVDKVGSKEIEVETGFIVPVEAREDYLSDYVTIDSFLQRLSKLPAHHVLLILDACHSGFALGQAMEKHRDEVRYHADLANHMSRKVITSARREQRALDGGPVAGHSLFTGTLIHGLDWGTADREGNDLVTSSELGLFLQQNVGQASKSEQTPDFGSFFLDDRGEMVISLRDDTFAALKARAFAALQRGEVGRFRELAEQVSARRPDSPEALYLQYRVRLFDSDAHGAQKLVKRLMDLDLHLGTIPLAQKDLDKLRVQLRLWEPIFAIPEGGFPLGVTLSSGADGDVLLPAKQGAIGELHGYHFESGVLARYEVMNPDDQPAHIYHMTIGLRGRLILGQVLQDKGLAAKGLGPKENAPGDIFRVKGAGLKETRLFWSPEVIWDLFSPPTTATRIVLDEEQLSQMRMKRVWHLVREPAGGREP